jgi:hypothetical protein
VTRSNRIYERRNKSVLRNPRHKACYSIGELDNLTTEITTLLELFNFVSEVSRLQYEWSSDWRCIWKSLGVNACLQWRNVFIAIGEVFLHSFLRFFRDYLWLHMRVSWSISIRRDRIRALLSLPRLALRAEKFQESSLCTWCAVNVVLWNWPCM